MTNATPHAVATDGAGRIAATIADLLERNRAAAIAGTMTRGRDRSDADDGGLRAAWVALAAELDASAPLSGTDGAAVVRVHAAGPDIVRPIDATAWTSIQHAVGSATGAEATLLKAMSGATKDIDCMMDWPAIAAAPDAAFRAVTDPLGAWVAHMGPLCPYPSADRNGCVEPVVAGRVMKLLLAPGTVNAAPDIVDRVLDLPFTSTEARLEALTTMFAMACNSTEWPASARATVAAQAADAWAREDDGSRGEGRRLLSQQDTSPDAKDVEAWRPLRAVTFRDLLRRHASTDDVLWWAWSTGDRTMGRGTDKSIRETLRRLEEKRDQVAGGPMLLGLLHARSIGAWVADRLSPEERAAAAATGDMRLLAILSATEPG